MQEDPKIIELLYGKSAPRRLSAAEQEIAELRKEHEDFLALIVDRASEAEIEQLKQEHKELFSLLIKKMASGTAQAPQGNDNG